jgi:hypothetical protein
MKYSAKSANQVTIKISQMTMTIIPRIEFNGREMVAERQEDTSDSIEGKDWGPSYLNLGCFVLFSKFCNQSYSTRTRSQSSGINIEPRLL